MTSQNELFNYLFDLEKKLHSFEFRSDSTKISTLLSSTFFEFGASGNSWTRENILERLPTEDGKNKIESYNYSAKPLSDSTVLVTYISKRISPAGETSEFLRSSIWKNNNGLWQMEFHQGTPKALVI